MTLDGWLRSHPYLAEVARVRRQIDEGVAGTPPLTPPASWDDYVEDYATGVPLLQSAVRIDLDPAGEAMIDALERLSIDVPPAIPARVVEWLLGNDDWQPAQPGLVRAVGWIAMATALRSIVSSLTAWKDDDRWLRRYCPCCGSAPAMAQLVGAEPGRRRLLTCGRCATQWRYGRTMCPFCETDFQQLSAITIEGERGLRVDYCVACRGYLKTYDGQGGEAVLLADWTSLHLDQLAMERGLQRLAASLYDLDLSLASTRLAASASN